MQNNLLVIVYNGLGRFSLEDVAAALAGQTTDGGFDVALMLREGPPPVDADARGHATQAPLPRDESPDPLLPDLGGHGASFVEHESHATIAQSGASVCSDGLAMFDGLSLTVREKAPAGGMVSAVNRVLRVTSHPYILVTDDETLPSPQLVARLIQAFDDDSSFSGFACSVEMYYSPGLLYSAGKGFSRSGHSFLRCNRLEKRNINDRPCEVFSPCLHAAAFRRNVFDDCGLFDEGLSIQAADTDFAFRARRKGHRFLYRPDLVLFRKSSLRGSAKRLRREYEDGRRDTWLVLARNVPAGALLNMFPSILAEECVSLLHALASGLAGTWLSAALSSMSMLTGALRKGMLFELDARLPFRDVEALFDDERHRHPSRGKLVVPVVVLALALALPLAFFVLVRYLTAGA